ncbi:MAG: response regulator [Sinorhizobium fredii]|uniref:Response regulator n=2 Tax=Rhizobium fredii TaxID=380 RepID=A0A2A6LS97_RHIFR|nr:response regulator [Sinorhizobium fredii]ASY67813.1 DNA-directed RNA polymerase specialized sigma subunit, sigma24-like [Sinorhizobium fredii CCBAU 83666]MCG5474821.1 response regulator [Sinorhizobium fredii]PDT45533.1 response regulator [Sinorhizobium fredii]CCE94897.1 Phyllosphere-induced regulator [Sinorhizobium fredii HH103]
MSLSTRIAPHLPYLRRYARAVTGSQAAGDAYVAAVLEALIEDISLFPSASNDRISLYKLFCSLFDKLKVDRSHLSSPFAWEQRAAANLSLIAPTPRQAFLLISVEGFSSGEAAEIMSIDQGAFAKLLSSASEEISRQVATDIMIIEDEPLIAMDIEDMVTSLGHRVTGIARTHREAIDIYRQTSPKMVLADIQLADGSSGVDAVNDILTQAAVPVIFITAFPERLLTGNKPEPAFLVTKPFNPEMVKALISQALFFDEHAQAGTR